MSKFLLSPIYWLDPLKPDQQLDSLPYVVSLAEPSSWPFARDLTRRTNPHHLLWLLLDKDICYIEHGDCETARKASTKLRVDRRGRHEHKPSLFL